MLQSIRTQFVFENDVPYLRLEDGYKIKINSQVLDTAIEFIINLKSNIKKNHIDPIMWEEKISRIGEDTINSLRTTNNTYSRNGHNLEKKISIAMSCSVESIDFVVYGSIIPSNVIIALFLENLELKENLFCKNYHFGAVRCGRYKANDYISFIVLSDKIHDQNHEKFTHFVELDLDVTGSRPQLHLGVEVEELAGVLR